MKHYLNISGDAESVIQLINNGKQSHAPQVVAIQTEPRVFTDWKEVASICRNGDASTHFKIGDYLSMKHPVFGFIEWEIARMEQDGFWGVARRPVAAMQFDAPEAENIGDKENKGSRGDWGSNNPLHCAPHKFLNSDKPAGEWWTKSNEFDHDPEEHKELPGFLSGIPADFLDCVRCTDIEMEVPECDGGGTGTQSLRFFLPSRRDIFAEDGKDAFFKLQSLKKSGCYWWLRSPDVGNSCYVYYVSSSGALNGNGANFTLGVVPACRIG